MAYGVGSVPMGVLLGAPMALSGREPPYQLLLNAHRKPNGINIAQSLAAKPKEGEWLKTRVITN